MGHERASSGWRSVDMAAVIVTVFGVAALAVG
jgi:hypothetical protein